MSEVIDMRKKAFSSEDREFVFGAEHTGSHACYMIYGVLEPGEKDRMIKPGRGHEEIVLAASGELAVSGALSCRLRQGEAFHVVEEQTAYLENPGKPKLPTSLQGGILKTVIIIDNEDFAKCL